MSARVLKVMQHEPQRQVREGLEPEELVRDYLDHLCAPLVGIVPFLERDRLRSEALFSIEQRQKAYVSDGLEPFEAAQLAIEKYGKTEKLVQDFLEEWVHYQPKGTVTKRIGLPHSYAAFFFGQAALWAFLVHELRMFYPSAEAVYNFGIPAADLRRILPEPIPLPDTNILTYIFLGFVLIAPIIAGYLTGRFSVVHAARASYHVLVIIILASFVLGMAMLPSYEGLFLALSQLLWWLPIGCLSAYIASAVTWRKRCAYQFTSTRRKS